MISFFKSQKTALELASGNLFRDRKRTSLSLLGVVIGVMLVIVVLSLGAGIKEYVLDQIEAFGSDIINVEIKVPGKDKNSSGNAGGIAGGTEIKTLTIEDSEELAKLKNLGAWYAGTMAQELVSFEKENEVTMIMGITFGIFEVDKNMKLVEGEEFTEQDGRNYQEYAILGSVIAENLFGDKKAVGQKVKIGSQKYLVRGVLEKRGANGFFDFDSIVYLPTQTVQKKLLGVDHVQWAVFKSNDTEKDPVTIKAMEKILRKNHDIDRPIDDDFAITSMAEATDIVSQVFAILNALLIGLTSISLVVGGVGIMNVMYVAVTERTFEIGLRKALGAKKQDILMQFIYEAIILTMIGGIVGILAGFTFSKTAEIIASKFDFILNFPVTLFSVILAVGFSMVTGIVFGYKPAKKASELTPIEALKNL